MVLNDTTVRALRALVADGKRRRPDLAPRIERALTVLLVREREPLGAGAYSIAAERQGSSYAASAQPCTCPDAARRGGPCKHMLAVRLLEPAEAAGVLAHAGARPAYGNAAD